MKPLALLLGLALCNAPLQLFAQGAGCVMDQSGMVLCGPPDSNCAANQRGEVFCTTLGGRLMPDQLRDLLCGPGYCLRDQRLDVYCSNQPRCGAIVTQRGDAVSAGPCNRRPNP